MITVACVRTGTKYSAQYLSKLMAGVSRNLKVPHEFVCLTDRPDEVPQGMREWDIAGYQLDGWWSKMLLFHKAIPARYPRILYFDLDTIIAGDLSPLASYHGRFGICANFTKRAGHPTWPCRYGSCVMSFATGSLHKTIWEPFRERRAEMIADAGKFGDQWAIEMLDPHADFLQDVMPAGFFAHFKRDLHRGAPRPENAIIVFGGQPKPHEVTAPWCAELWAAA